MLYSLCCPQHQDFLDILVAQCSVPNAVSNGDPHPNLKIYVDLVVPESHSLKKRLQHCTAQYNDALKKKCQ